MRSPKIDFWKVTVQRLGTETALDRFGNPIQQYEEEEQIFATVSAGVGNTYFSVFGKSITFDKEMVTTHDYGLDEYTKIWLDGQEYRITAIAKSKHIYRYAISRVSEV